MASRVVAGWRGFGLIVDDQEVTHIIRPHRCSRWSVDNAVRDLTCNLRITRSVALPLLEVSHDLSPVEVAVVLSGMDLSNLWMIQLKHDAPPVRHPKWTTVASVADDLVFLDA